VAFAVGAAIVAAGAIASAVLVNTKAKDRGEDRPNPLSYANGTD
jgi:hypothetical protein